MKSVADRIDVMNYADRPMRRTHDGGSAMNYQQGYKARLMKWLNEEEPLTPEEVQGGKCIHGWRLHMNKGIGGKNGMMLDRERVMIESDPDNEHYLYGPTARNVSIVFTRLADSMDSEEMALEAIGFDRVVGMDALKNTLEQLADAEDGEINSSEDSATE